MTETEDFEFPLGRVPPFETPFNSSLEELENNLDFDVVSSLEFLRTSVDRVESFERRSGNACELIQHGTIRQSALREKMKIS